MYRVRKDPHLICMAMPYFDRIGGAELQLLSLSKLFLERGKRVMILTDVKPGLAAYERKEGIAIYRVPMWMCLSRSVRFYLFYLFFLKIRKIPSVFHCHTNGSFVDQILSFAHFFKIPTLVKIATSGDMDCLRQSIDQRLSFFSLCKNLGKFNVRALERTLFGKHRRQRYLSSSAMISINPSIRSEIEQFGYPVDRIVSIPNGIDVQRFSPLSLEQKNRAKDDLHLSSSFRYIAFLGRFIERKRCLDLIHAWASLKASYPEYRLLLVGDGEERELYEKLCIDLKLSSRVIFTGLVEKPERYLQVSDLFVFPSRLEGLPNVVLEAMAVGLPMVVSQIPGIAELVDHRKTGWLFPPGDIDSLREGIEYLLSHPEEAKKMGAAAREKISKTHAFDQIAPQFLAVYETLFLPQHPRL